MADISDTLADDANSPKRAQGDSGSMEQHPLPDKIEADRYIKSNAAARRGLGMRHIKLIPGGADD